MNVTPKSVFKGTNSNGSKFRMEEWDFNTLAQIELVSFVCLMLTVLLLSAFLPILLLILTIIYFNGRFAIANIVGLIGSIYFLYDCSHGWLTLITLTFVFEEPTIALLYGLNIGACIGHILIILFGGIIFKSVNENKTMFGIIISFAFIIGLFINTNNSTSHNKGWVHNNIHPKEIPVVDNRTYEQIDADNEKEYEASRVANGYSAKNSFDKNRGE